MSKSDPDRLEVTAENVAALLRHYGIADFSFREIEEGIENRSVLVESGGQTYVLRAYRQGRKDVEAIKQELAFQTYLRERRLPIPRVYANLAGTEFTAIEIDGRVWHAILMEFVEGTSNTGYTPELIRNLGHLQARMHLFGIEFAEAMGKRGPAWTGLVVDGPGLRAKDSDLPEAILAFIERGRPLRLPLDPLLPHGYNHLDLDLWGNIIVQGGAVRAIIDFANLAYSPCVVCLANSVLPVLDGSGEQGLWDYLAAYESVRPLTSEEYDSLPGVMLRRSYSVGLGQLSLAGGMEHAERVLGLERRIPAITWPRRG